MWGSLIRVDVTQDGRAAGLEVFKVRVRNAAQLPENPATTTRPDGHGRTLVVNIRVRARRPL